MAKDQGLELLKSQFLFIEIRILVHSSVSCPSVFSSQTFLYGSYSDDLGLATWAMSRLINVCVVRADMSVMFCGGYSDKGDLLKLKLALVTKQPEPPMVILWVCREQKRRLFIAGWLFSKLISSQWASSRIQMYLILNYIILHGIFPIHVCMYKICIFMYLLSKCIF